MAGLNSIERAAPLEAEEWRDIPGFDRYQVSSYGNVRSKCVRGTLARRRSDWKSLAHNVEHGGYPAVMLSTTAGVKRKWLVHRLVLLAFVGACPDGMEVNHIDGVKTNNLVNNLEYVSSSENSKHAYQRQ